MLTFDKEIKAHLATIQQLKVHLSNVERERDRNVTTTHTQLGKADTIQMELDLKIKQYADLKECLDALQVKYTHLNQQYDTSQSERNALQQELTTILADREVVREKLRVNFTSILR